MAGSGRRVFSPGEVLTASNTMNYLMDQTVMNFAGTAARGSAIGTAVAEGMVSYLADTNDVQVYDGSAWNDLAYQSAVDSLPTPGLVPIIAPTVNYSGGTATANTLGEINFSAVTSISLNGIFTTSYKFYKIVIKTTNTSANNLLVARYRASGTDLATNYYQGGTRAASNGSNIALAVNNGTYIYGIELDAAAPTRGFLSLEITNAERALNTQFMYNAHGSIPAVAPAQYTGSGVVPNTTIYDGLTFLLTSAGNMTGTVQVFGHNS